MEDFLSKYAYIAVLIVMVVEYLIGISKIKPNSTIDMVISIIKFIFGMKKEEEPKEEKPE